jgi:exopolysaccharide biosynthesis protein PssK
MHPADAALVERLRQQFHAVLGRTLRGANECTLVDFPRHRNAGDSAIWLGELRALRTLGVKIRATCDRKTYSARRLRRCVGDHPILLHGGGNLGDLYPTHQQLRERVLADFRGHPTVQLAQTIHFNDPVNLERMRRVVADHGALTIVVRDRRSEALARENFDAHIELAPDAAFTLGPLARRDAAVMPVLRLARIDREAPQPTDGSELPTHDWLAAPRSRRGRGLLAVSDRLLALAVGGRRAGLLPISAHGAAFEAYARQNLRRATQLLSQGEVVVTDRLHGHILCVLLGIPHVLVDDRYGKVSSFFACWTSDLRLARFPQEPGEAAALADELLRAGRDSAPAVAASMPA